MSQKPHIQEFLLLTIKIGHGIRRALRRRVDSIPLNMLMKQSLLILNEAQRLSVREPPHLRADHWTNQVSQGFQEHKIIIHISQQSTPTMTILI